MSRKWAPMLFGLSLVMASCTTQNPVQPDAVASGTPLSTASAGSTGSPATAIGRPGYEPAYYNGETVTINAIEVRQNAGPLEHAAADLYEVVYPPDSSLWPSEPQCNPCDHDGQGIDFLDYHDHTLDSIPSSPGHGEYNALWRVLAIVPADMSPAGQAAYAALLPLTSEAAIDAAVEAGVADEMDTGFYFECAVVNPHAAP